MTAWAWTSSLLSSSHSSSNTVMNSCISLSGSQTALRFIHSEIQAERGTLMHRCRIYETNQGHIGYSGLCIETISSDVVGNRCHHIEHFIWRWESTLWMKQQENWGGSEIKTSSIHWAGTNRKYPVSFAPTFRR